MIVLFIKSDRIRTQPLPHYTCPNCSQTDGMTMELHQRYADFAGGKVYPNGVFGVVQCAHCHYTLPASRWTDDLHRAYLTLKADYRTPIAYWKGAIRTAIGFVVGLVLLVGVLSFMGQAQRAELNKRETIFNEVLRNPKPGTTVAVVGNNTGMEVWRISRVEGQTIWLRHYAGNRTLTNVYDETGWASLADSEFSDDAVGYSRAKFADKGLKRIEDMGEQVKPDDGTVFAVLDK